MMNSKLASVWMKDGGDGKTGKKSRGWVSVLSFAPFFLLFSYLFRDMLADLYEK